ncbi:hypothetical protein [Candidatus Lokiarchaeum ossiferum]|uniref:hypothetical protein n=1 Tax=Candidatus Lokiarchaeum ossiferum TaxID=2951803 RepID=UPI00352CBEEB
MNKNQKTNKKTGLFPIMILHHLDRSVQSQLGQNVPPEDLLAHKNAFGSPPIGADLRTRGKKPLKDPIIVR